MTSWAEIAEMDPSVPEAAVPKYGLTGHTYHCRIPGRREESDEVRLNVFHPERELQIGVLAFATERLPEWMLDVGRLAVEFDDDRTVAGLHYLYRTKYEAPTYGTIELDPTVPGWIELPRGTYSVEELNRVARLWRWEELDEAYCPPAGAGRVMTNQRPNDADVPIQFVPAAALSERTEAGDVLVPPEGDRGGEDADETVPLTEFSRDEAATRRRADLVERAVRSRADRIRDGADPAGPDPGSLYLDYDSEAAEEAFSEPTHVVVEYTTDDSVAVRRLEVSRPERDADLDRFTWKNHQISLDSTPDNHTAEFDLTTAGPLVHLASRDSRPRDPSDAAVFRVEIDPSAVERGDVFEVDRPTDAADPDAQRAARIALEQYDSWYRLREAVNELAATEEKLIQSGETEAFVDEYTITPRTVEALPADIESESELRAALESVTVDVPDEQIEEIHALALRFDPVLTGLFRHQLPEFEANVPDGQPEHWAEGFPYEDQFRLILGDGDIGGSDYTHAVKPVEKEERVVDAVLCEYCELPPEADAPKLRYEIAPDSPDPTPRFTRGWSDPGLTELQRAYLTELAVDEDEEPPAREEIDERIGVEDPPFRTLLALKDRGLLVKHGTNSYEITEKGRRALDRG